MTEQEQNLKRLSHIATMAVWDVTARGLTRVESDRLEQLRTSLGKDWDVAGQRWEEFPSED